ncbi:hypothetical protein [Paraburkholderia kururiensis]|uniref:hypothetical protein n=1 Tax=Paraburkholderia kururiensis TaxID=984307 RepID=UPI00034A533F|nr:hypothetical protein [Paraburkholderia kururiensis]
MPDPIGPNQPALSPAVLEAALKEGRQHTAQIAQANGKKMPKTPAEILYPSNPTGEQ